MAVPVKGDYPIKLGTLLFTMVEPTHGHELEYNRWYEHDHFYAGCMIGPWQFAGDRFVATRRLKDLRYPTETDMTPDPLTGSYLAIYWVLDGHHDEWNRWAVDQVNWLHANGRMYEERQHIHTLLYTNQWSKRRDPNGCTIELALDHGYPGLVVVCGDVKVGHTHEEVDAWFQDTYLPEAMQRDWGPELVSSSTTLPLLDDRPADVVAPAAGPTALHAAPLPRSRSGRGLGRRLRHDRRRHQRQRPCEPRVDRAVHQHGVGHRHLRGRALVNRWHSG